MRSKRLYFATRSPRLGAPVLMNPAFSATAKSAKDVSSVSPLRWETIAANPDFCASLIACIVSVTVPIWFSLIKIALPQPSAMPRAKRAVFVTNKSSPTRRSLPPSAAVIRCQPDQSSSSKPSSKDTMGYLPASCRQCSISSSAV